MSKKKPDEKKAGEKEAETDPFLLASLTHYKLTEYPDPVSFSGSAYVVTVKLWPGYLLIKDVKWETIETEHELPGPLLQAFQAALVREFPSQETSHRSLMRAVGEHFKEVADIVIHFDKKRGPETLLKRCHLAIEAAGRTMTSLLAARMECEQGVAAADMIRQAKSFDPSRYPAEMAATIAKIAKTAGPGKSRPRSAVQPGVCEWCSEYIDTDFATHNKSCSQRIQAKGDPPAKKRKTKKELL